MNHQGISNKIGHFPKIIKCELNANTEWSKPDKNRRMQSMKSLARNDEISSSREWLR